MKKQNYKTTLLLVILLSVAVIATLSFQLYNQKIKNINDNTVFPSNTITTTAPNLDTSVLVTSLDDIYKNITESNIINKIPENFEKLLDSQSKEDKNIAPDGLAAQYLIYTDKSNNQDTTITFYIEVLTSKPCFGEDDSCDPYVKPVLHGPFEGNLSTILQ